MNRRGLAAACAVAVLTFACAGGARAEVITLDFTSGTFGAGFFGYNSYTQQGFTLQTVNPDHPFVPHDQLFSHDADGISWAGMRLGDPIILSVTYAGGAFDFTSITIADNLDGFSFASSRGVVQVPQGVTGVVDFNWTNITSFTIQATGGQYGATIDDIVLNNVPTAPVVPLPAAAWAGAALLGGLGASRHLRRRPTDQLL